MRINKHSLFIISTVVFLLMALPETKAQGFIKLNFINKANGRLVELHDSSYVNNAGESYSIRKLKYYISNLKLNGHPPFEEKDNYHLIDEARNKTILLPVRNGAYSQLSFMLGIDSSMQVSGAQEGALDPMNDMYWTWNTGYVAFKLDGTSPASTADRNRIEHHIGGYRAGANVSTIVDLDFQPVKVNGDTAIINIVADLDKYWNGHNKITIAADAVCATPGELAMRIAKNFKGMFSVLN